MDSAESTEAVKVAVRLRPLLERENPAEIAWCALNDHTIASKSGHECYSFGMVYDETSRNLDVYNRSVKDVVSSAVAGYNGTVFAYGQTASGKTHTIFGRHDGREPGIMQLALDSLFETCDSCTTRNYMLRVSCMEIYNEKVRDLLSGDLKVLDLKECHGKTVVLGITEEVIADRECTFEYIRRALERRITGSTALNDRSSRSHVIIRLVIDSKDEEEGSSYTSYLNLIDLAGSENASLAGTEGQSKHEGGNVNKSLLALSKVISELCDKSQHISFRDSKLTRLLKSSLGGNAKTVIICNVSPVCRSETAQTLMFAQRAMNVKNRPRRNKMTGDQLLSQYLDTISSLKAKILADEEKIEEQRELAARNATLEKEVTRLRKCILGGTPEQSYSKVRKARRQTWGGCLMPVLPTFSPMPVITETQSTPSSNETAVECSVSSSPNDIRNSEEENSGRLSSINGNRMMEGTQLIMDPVADSVSEDVVMDKELVEMCEIIAAESGSMRTIEDEQEDCVFENSIVVIPSDVFEEGILVENVLDAVNSNTEPNEEKENSVLKAKVAELEDALKEETRKRKLAEETQEIWGQRCDEADEIESELRLEIYNFSEKIKILRANFEEKIAELQSELKMYKKLKMEFDAAAVPDRIELETLRLRVKDLEDEKKKMLEELANRNSKVMALKKELRRVVGKEEVVHDAAEMPIFATQSHPADAETPPRKVLEFSMPSAPGRSGKSILSVDDQEHYREVDNSHEKCSTEGRSCVQQ